MTYKSFFEKIEEFKIEQTKQKQRGLNDYNMVNVVRSERSEVGMHSNVIISLIDPHGLHYQDDLFLQHFIKEVIEPSLKEKIGDSYSNFGEVFEVQAEEKTDQDRRIDFTIKSDKYFIGIEMKIDAGDLKNQISDYKEDLSKKAKDQEVVIFYLTKDGKDAKSDSKKSIEIMRISFKEHILKWIEACQKEVRNITNLNEAFENYKNIVKKITDKYEGNIESLESFLDKTIYTEFLSKIEKIDSNSYTTSIIEAKENYKNKFYKILKDKLEARYDCQISDYHPKNYLNFKRYGYNLHFTHMTDNILQCNIGIKGHNDNKQIDDLKKIMENASLPNYKDEKHQYQIGEIMLSNTDKLFEICTKIIDKIKNQT